VRGREQLFAGVHQQFDRGGDGVEVVEGVIAEGGEEVVGQVVGEGKEVGVVRVVQHVADVVSDVIGVEFVVEVVGVVGDGGEVVIGGEGGVFRHDSLYPLVPTIPKANLFEVGVGDEFGERRVDHRGGHGEAEVLGLDERDQGVAAGVVFVRAESVRHHRERISGVGVVVIVITRVIELGQRAVGIDVVLTRREVVVGDLEHGFGSVVLQLQHEAQALAVIERERGDDVGRAVVIGSGGGRGGVSFVRHALIIPRPTPVMQGVGK
jgi:hypothetical protein